jgi:hypothetical protein
MDKLFVEKTTGTPADTLLAFGVAHFLDTLIPQDAAGVNLRVEDWGNSLCIDLNTPFRAEWASQAGFFSMIPGLNTSTKSVAVAWTVDYKKHQQRNSLYFESLKSGLDEKQLQEQGIDPPDLDWPVWAIINQMSAATTYNKLVELWYAHENCFPELATLILEMYGRRPNETGAAGEGWTELAKKQGIQESADIAQLQVVNPGMGKGGNRSKASGLGIGGLKAFWLPEYLKFAGLYKAAIPRVVRGEKDRKTYILSPNKLEWRTHKNIFPEFQKVMYAQTAIKMDILTNLTYCRTFLTQWMAGQGSQHRRARGNPGNHVGAVETIYYKHLGSAHATLNLSSLALPDWTGTEITTKEEAQTFLDLLEEHSFVIYRLDEKRGSEYNLLDHYRHFLSGRDLNMFYQFMGGYSAHLMSELAGGGNPPQFSITNLEVLIMAHDEDKKLTEIIQNEGFRNIAEAIRRSTVIPQGQKARGRDSLYDIRYGLGSKLLRKAQYNESFVQELSQFMHDYNHENARKLETRKQQYRSNITMDDIENIVSLIDKFNAPTVANLLVAFGYARDPNLGKSSEDEAEATE